MKESLSRLERALFERASEGPLTKNVLNTIDEFIEIYPVTYMNYLQIISRLNAQLDDDEKLVVVGKGSQKDGIFPIYSR